jgi:integrase
MPKIAASGVEGVIISDTFRGGVGVGKRWLVRVLDLHGRYQGRRFAEKAEGKAWGKAQRKRFQAGKGSAGAVYLAEVAKTFLEDLGRRGRSSHHLAAMRAAFASAVKAGVGDLKHLAIRAQVVRWLSKAGSLHPTRKGAVSPRTRNKRLGYFRALTRWLVDHEQLDRDPMRALKPETDPAKGRERRVFMVEELRHLVAEEHRADPWWLRACLMIYTGCRIGEAHALRWEWINWQAGTVSVRQAPGLKLKQGWERSIPFQPELVEILTPRRQASGPILPEAAGESDDIRGRGFRAYCGRCGVVLGDRSPHSTRHTWVSLMLATGLDSFAVQRAAGHRVVLTTQVYAHAVAPQEVAGWPRGVFRLRDGMPAAVADEVAEALPGLA